MMRPIAIAEIAVSTMLSEIECLHILTHRHALEAYGVEGILYIWDKLADDDTYNHTQ